MRHKKFTVLLRYPDYLSQDWPDELYVAKVFADSSDEAIKKARLEVTQANELIPFHMDDFAVVYVFSGFCEAAEDW